MLLDRVFAAITFGGMAVGRASAHLPDYIKAKQAAANIKDLLAKKSSIDPTSTEGDKPVSSSTSSGLLTDCVITLSGLKHLN